MTAIILPEKTTEYLSKIGIRPYMTVGEVYKLFTQLSERMGKKDFDPLVNQVYLNLNSIQPGKSFAYLKYFKGNKAEAFIVIAYLYITENPLYEFANDYRSIRRINNPLKQKINYGKNKQRNQRTTRSS